MEYVSTFTALAIASGGLLLAVCCLMSRIGARFGLPLSLMFLVIGMLAGPEGLAPVRIERFDIAYAFGTLALVVILFSGGFETSFNVVRRGIGPASILATLGVVGVAGLTALGGRLLGLGWGEALLVGAIVSSTDAAAVFAALHGTHLKGRVGPTIEVESGMNDPVAVILTTAMTAHLIGSRPLSFGLIPDVMQELAIGAVSGIVVGYIGRWALNRVPLSMPALYPVLTTGIALLTFGKATLLGGSGFLAVYACAVIIGNGHVPHRHMISRSHESIAWLAQVSMFVLLGMMVVPSELPPVIGRGLLLALFIAFIARPVVVALCLAPFKFNWRETVCIGWCGLRGAMPIILATLPVLSAEGQPAEIKTALNAFELVFFIGIVGSIIPGSTVRWITRVLGLQEPTHPHAPATFIIDAHHPTGVAHQDFFIDDDSAVAGRTLRQIQLPTGSAVVGVVRDHCILPARGETQLLPGDHAFLLTRPGCETAVSDVFTAKTTIKFDQTRQGHPHDRNNRSTQTPFQRRDSWQTTTVHS